VSVTRKTKQPRLLPALAPICEGDALSIDDLTTRYRCWCGNQAEIDIKLDAVTCVKCGSAMKAVPP
jgi:Zn finger protein HypA/HybF involved in hydrogenase expression